MDVSRATVWRPPTGITPKRLRRGAGSLIAISLIVIMHTGAPKKLGGRPITIMADFQEQLARLVARDVVLPSEVAQLVGRRLHFTTSEVFPSRPNRHFLSRAPTDASLSSLVSTLGMTSCRTLSQSPSPNSAAATERPAGTLSPRGDRSQARGGARGRRGLCLGGTHNLSNHRGQLFVHKGFC